MSSEWEGLRLKQEKGICLHLLRKGKRREARWHMIIKWMKRVVQCHSWSWEGEKDGIGKVVGYTSTESWGLQVTHFISFPLRHLWKGIVPSLLKDSRTPIPPSHLISSITTTFTFFLFSFPSNFFYVFILYTRAKYFYFTFFFVRF